ncbi:MAG: hypothetical protein LBL81_05060 [Tannerella sp.]|jgi:hypothetical protein|nr:hypothetical protein [Tannerella sp.]
MKKNAVYLLMAGVLMVGMAACGGKKANENKQEAAREKAAAEAGIPSKNLLTAEIKEETLSYLHDMPASELPYRLANGQVKIGVGNLSYMLPVQKADELTTPAQKARACGIYLSDYVVLKTLGQPGTELEKVLGKLTQDLDVTFVLNIVHESLPPAGTGDDFGRALQAQEKQIMDQMEANNKVDMEIELLGGMAAESACFYANPSLVVKGDATWAGLSDNMLKRLGILQQIISDLSNYYPDLKQLGEVLSPLKGKIGGVTETRAAKADILSIRNALLK